MITTPATNLSATVIALEVYTSPTPEFLSAAIVPEETPHPVDPFGESAADDDIVSMEASQPDSDDGPMTVGMANANPIIPESSEGQRDVEFRLHPNKDAPYDFFGDLIFLSIDGEWHEKTKETTE